MYKLLEKKKRSIKLMMQSSRTHYLRIATINTYAGTLRQSAGRINRSS